MTQTSLPPVSHVSRRTGLVLGLVIFVCLVMIGLAGFLKYELDRSETVLTIPLAANPSIPDEGQESLDKLRRTLGYGGFIGQAQNFAATHDAAVLDDMKGQLKEAESTFARIPEQTAAGSRRDLRAILDTFGAVLQKAEKVITDPATVFTLSDLAPLYAALPLLDARVNAAWDVRRANAEGQAQFWGMLLTLTCWCSLILAAALAAGIYLVLRDRNSAPLRALAQSVKNMARGDMRTSIWGMERHDSIGELARAIDMARYQFSQMPDMTLLSEECPIRLRFEGNTRSLFEAMMRVVSRDSEQLNEKATHLNDSIAKQQETLSLLTERVEAVLHKVESRAVQGDQQVRQSLQSIVASAEGLKSAQEHAVDQLNRIVPYLQDRARGLSEITQLTGKQVAHVLQSLVVTERNLKKNAEQGDEAIHKLSSTADNLGERLFGAVNLLQASGRVLAETTEKTQSRLDEAIENFKMTGTSVNGSGALSDTVAPRIENAIEALESTHAKMETLLAEQTEATKAQIDLLTTQSCGLLTQTTTASQTLASSSDRLRDEQAKLDEAIGRFATRMQELGDQLEGRVVSTRPQGTEAVGDNMEKHFAELEGYVVRITEQIVDLTHHNNAALSQEPAFVGSLMKEIKSGFDVIGSSLEHMREQMSANTPTSAVNTSDISEQMRNQWYQMASQIEATRAGLAQIISQEVTRLETSLAELNAEPNAPVESEALHNAQHQIEQQTNILAELVATLSVLDAHMQEIRSEVAQMRRAG